MPNEHHEITARHLLLEIVYPKLMNYLRKCGCNPDNMTNEELQEMAKQVIEMDWKI